MNARGKIYSHYNNNIKRKSGLAHKQRKQPNRLPV